MKLADQLRRMGLSDDQIAATMVDGKPLAEAESQEPQKSRRQWDPYRSKWEFLYAAELEDQRRADQILDWQYEAITFLLSPPQVGADGKTIKRQTYTPDFDVWREGERLQCVEVKGRKREAGINKFKLAKSRFPGVDFVMLRRGKSGWEIVM